MPHRRREKRLRRHPADGNVHDLPQPALHRPGNARARAPEFRENNRPIEWTRVHDLPDFVYFNHSIHVNKGIGCTACHGHVNEMQLIWQDQTLYMAWCLQCHRHPEKYIGPRSEVFDPQRVALKDQGKLDWAKQLVKDYHVQSSGVLTDCYTCHR